ncbi:hypothetical protein [Polaribacter sp. Asnod6-C07]|uniref:hypothetical protein n=1 Tax=Polaribacter sp. Asnod6-C07 TaxID=3160582 RepID=UPI003868F997
MIQKYLFTFPKGATEFVFYIKDTGCYLRDFVENIGTEFEVNEKLLKYFGCNNTTYYQLILETCKKLLI